MQSSTLFLRICMHFLLDVFGAMVKYLSCESSIHGTLYNVGLAVDQSSCINFSNTFTFYGTDCLFVQSNMRRILSVQCTLEK